MFLYTISIENFPYTDLMCSNFNVFSLLVTYIQFLYTMCGTSLSIAAIDSNNFSYTNRNCTKKQSISLSYKWNCNFLFKFKFIYCFVMNRFETEKNGSKFDTNFVQRLKHFILNILRCFFLFFQWNHWRTFQVIELKLKILIRNLYRRNAK